MEQELPVTKGREGKAISFRAEAAAACRPEGFPPREPCGKWERPWIQTQDTIQADRWESLGSFTYSFNKHLLSAHFVPDTGLGAGDIPATEKAKRKYPDFKELTVS